MEKADVFSKLYEIVGRRQMNKSEFWAKYAKQLNEKQLQAVCAVHGPVLLLAVPGSGKTTVLMTRLGYMLFCEGISPQNILTLTYTVAATRDMERRFGEIFGGRSGNGVDGDGVGEKDVGRELVLGSRLEFRTINGICAKVIQRYAGMIGKKAFELVTEEKELGRVLTNIMVSYMEEYPTESDVNGMKTLITYCKNMLLSESEIQKLGEQEGVPLWEVYRAYNAYLREHGLMDYDDQMLYAYRLLKQVPELLRFYQERYRYICVDEAQDTSKIQHIIIKLLAGENGNLFMVGDEDQSIYGFRAAYPEALLAFEREHTGAQVLVMDQNYRSGAGIVAVADRFIGRNQDRHEKHMVAVRETEAEVRVTELKGRANQYGYLCKVAADCSRETAVLYRDNESALPLIDLLLRQGISYRMRGMDMGFFTHRVVTDVTNILRFAQDPYDTELFLRIYFKCKTYLKKPQAEQLCRISETENIPVLDAVDELRDVSDVVRGKCKAFQTHLRNMLDETPGKALYRIETPLGYGEYLERNHIDGNKLFILRMLAKQEEAVNGFLERLQKLRLLLQEGRQDEECQFILSTIHSAKGLEYERVYLLDVCDGVFPAQAIGPKTAATSQERKAFEEERRLFYVGMTRAKDELILFQLADRESCFVREVRSALGRNAQETGRGDRAAMAQTPRRKREVRKAYEIYAGKADTGKDSVNVELIIGERVIQRKYGAGVVNDVEYDAAGRASKFTVVFDSGVEKAFMFPIAFRSGMRLEG